jgi:hypothetical protein
MSGGIFNWFDSPYSFSSAVVTINYDGTVELHVGAQEIGQGSSTTLAMICAEALGVKLEDIKVHMGDTDHSPADLGAWGSDRRLWQVTQQMAAEDESSSSSSPPNWAIASSMTRHTAGPGVQRGPAGGHELL